MQVLRSITTDTFSLGMLMINTLAYIYLDLQKTFDKVGPIPHQRLRLKLKSHTMAKSIINLIEQWLTDRRQRVVSGRRGFKVETSFWCSTTRMYSGLRDLSYEMWSNNPGDENIEGYQIEVFKILNCHKKYRTE